ncbi:MAG: AAA family ATPase [Krumholzibacteria bacterium]|nr:AAA family ATPase [Candidatus Krumholzibacteria bacterium]
MYLDHFGLLANPFGLSPKLDFLFRSEAFEESMAHLVYGVDNGEPLVMITGPIGTGKTMAIQSFLSHLGEHFETALVTNTRVDGRELLKLILDDLGVNPPPGSDKSDLLIAFKNHLLANSAAGRRVLIVVDEAQNLKADALEEIRLLTNLGQGHDQPVQLVLVGQPELEDVVDSPGLRQLRQRIRVHYRLEPLSRAEVEGYVHHRMAVAGSEAEVFSRGALDRIYELSAGVPRVVNTLANEGLLAAYVAGRDKVRPEDIEAPRPRTRPAAVPEEPAARPGGAERSAYAVAAAPDVAPAFTYARTRRRKRRAAAWVVSVLALAAVGIVAGLYFLTDLFASASGPNAGPYTAVPSAAEPPRTVAADTMPLILAEAGEAAPADADTSGTAPVSAVVDTSIDSAATPPAEFAPTVPDGEWCVHIGSFRTEDRAITYASELSTYAPGAFYRYDLVRGVGWYRVFIGPFGDRATALAEAHRLQSELGVRYYKIISVGGAAQP